MDILVIMEIVLQTIGFITVLLQLIPELDKYNKIKPILQFLGKYIALNKPVVRELIYKK